MQNLSYAIYYCTTRNTYGENDSTTCILKMLYSLPDQVSILYRLYFNTFIFHQNKDDTRGCLPTTLDILRAKWRRRWYKGRIFFQNVLLKDSFVYHSFIYYLYRTTFSNIIENKLKTRIIAHTFFEKPLVAYFQQMYK